jgi:hypothetical protein
LRAKEFLAPPTRRGWIPAQGAQGRDDGETGALAKKDWQTDLPYKGEII